MTDVNAYMQNVWLWISLCDEELQVPWQLAVADAIHH
jgi:hypothetical protein